MSTSCRLSHETLLRLEEIKPRLVTVNPYATKSNDAAIATLMDFFETKVLES